LKSSVRLGRIAGIDVGIHYTWLFAFALIAWSLAAGFFPSAAPGLPAPTYWLLGVAAALGLFASVLIHEFRHSFVALARGLRVQSITLFIFGGVSTIVGEAKRSLDEFLIAVVGPLSSFVLAGVFWAAGHVAHADGSLPRLSGVRQPDSGRVQPGAGLAARRRAGAAIDRLGRQRQLATRHAGR
jgi:Zn-dependent protease